MKKRFLTKSRFKLALECPTKLFYTGKKEYVDGKLKDEFLLALAKGGFQVGELAKLYFPGGINIEELDHSIAIDKTNELLKRDNVIIYEAAFQYQNLFIRADIVVKVGNNIRLLEVKAKSYDSSESFLTKKDLIASKWKPYLYDIAFQKYVIREAFPDFNIKSYLLLADKSAVTTVDGLNQLFLIQQDESGRSKVEVAANVTLDKLGKKILTEVPVDDIIESVIQAEKFNDNPDKSFVEWIHHYAEGYENDKLISHPLGGHCGECEFKANLEEELKGFKSGFKECWKREARFSDSDFTKPHVLEIWDSRKKDEYIKTKRYFQSDLSRVDLEPKKTKKTTHPGLTRIDRQELQLNTSSSIDGEPYIDIEGLKSEMKMWVFPLHFIDFETSAVAIPFNIDRRPYEQIAFQFSHHIVHEDGTVEHKDQWINTTRGQFPNFDFVRALKKSLEQDRGSIFRYATHENSILNAIYSQLKVSSEHDRELLCQWIQTITHSSSNSLIEWTGERDMIDLLELVKRYYYHPMMKGSNSIKAVLPAVISSSSYVKEKYSQSIYGDKIKSLNFEHHTWIRFDETGKVINPYKTLDPIFKNVDEELLDRLLLEEDSELQDGGGAMMAYAKMQFSQMQNEERILITNALLRYCELDTLAMVMLVEGWMNYKAADMSHS